MLNMFDSKTPVGGSVLLFGPLEQIEHGVNRTVPDCMNRDLQTRLIGPLDAGIHPSRVHQIRARQTAVTGSVRERSIHPGRLRSQRAVGKALQIAHAQDWTAKTSLDARSGEGLPIAQWGGVVDANCQRPGASELLKLPKFH